jgi:hypothetical protein
MKKILEKIQKKFQNFINSLAETNESSFGKGKMDCCDINKKNEDTKSTK